MNNPADFEMAGQMFAYLWCKIVHYKHKECVGKYYVECKKCGGYIFERGKQQRDLNAVRFEIERAQARSLAETMEKNLDYLEKKLAKMKAAQSETLTVVHEDFPEDSPIFEDDKSDID